MNKEAGNEWFTIESNKLGTRWTGKVQRVHALSTPLALKLFICVCSYVYCSYVWCANVCCSYACCSYICWHQVWYVHNLLKYEFDLEFDLPVSYPGIPLKPPCIPSPLSDSIPYDPVPSHPTLPTTLPATAPELALPELDGKTEKMYRGGKICLDSHFRPLWARNVPHFGIAHAMALGMGPWLAVEIPSLIEKGRCVSGVRYQLGISTGHLVLDGGRLVRVATPSAPSLTSSAGRAAHQQDCSSRGRIEDSLREVASV